MPERAVASAARELFERMPRVDDALAVVAARADATHARVRLRSPARRRHQGLVEDF